MAVTLDYTFPDAGGATEPTQARMAGRSLVQGTIIKSADGDNTVTITHNMQLTAAQLTQGFPEVVLEPLLANYYITNPFVASKTADTVVLTLGTGGGSGNAGAQIRFRIRRPHSMDQ
jgi:hypothetical protein